MGVPKFSVRRLGGFRAIGILLVIVGSSLVVGGGAGTKQSVVVVNPPKISPAKLNPPLPTETPKPAWPQFPLPIISPVPLSADIVDTPMEIIFPTLNQSWEVRGVGLTNNNEMNVPLVYGSPDWQKTFWYRGGAVPGEPGTATIAGHVDDWLGRSTSFTDLNLLHVGDLVVVTDKRTNIQITFKVTEIANYSLQEGQSSAVLSRVFGDSNSEDPTARLNLITCTGSWYIQGGLWYLDHRMVVYTQRVS